VRPLCPGADGCDLARRCLRSVLPSSTRPFDLVSVAFLQEGASTVPAGRIYMDGIDLDQNRQIRRLESERGGREEAWRERSVWICVCNSRFPSDMKWPS